MWSGHGNINQGFSFFQIKNGSKLGNVVEQAKSKLTNIVIHWKCADKIIPRLQTLVEGLTMVPSTLYVCLHLSIILIMYLLNIQLQS